MRMDEPAQKSSSVTYIVTAKKKNTFFNFLLGHRILKKAAGCSERRTLKLVPLNISMTFRNSTDDGEILHLMEQ